MNKKIHNHLLPRMVIKRWEDEKARIFVKNAILPFSRPVHKYDYSEQYYYSLGKEDSELEDRISSFETYVGRLLKKLNNANGSIELLEKDMEILKLYVVLQSCRNESTSSYIKSDAFGIYQNNNYLFGVPLLSTQKEVIDYTKTICDEFERIKDEKNDADYSYEYRIIAPGKLNSYLCLGLHLVIVNNSSNGFIISDTTAVIECTMDSDYLYTYVPVSPKIGLLLVKSKYFWNLETIEYTKARFGDKYGNGNPDPWLSDAIQDSKLIYNGKTNNHLVTLSIVNLSKAETYHLNSVIYEDGNKILYSNDDSLKISKIPNPSRVVS